jgi:uncharacterized protein YdhG (YjbR/CyaY superfamily)
MAEKQDTPEAAAAAAARIDATLAALPADQRAALAAVRAQIAAAAPDAIEAISYGAPAFRYRGRPLMAYMAATAHCSLLPMSPAIVAAHLPELAGYETAKGTIRFTPDHPLPDGLVERIVHERMAEIDAR